MRGLRYFIGLLWLVSAWVHAAADFALSKTTLNAITQAQKSAQPRPETIANIQKQLAKDIGVEIKKIPAPCQDGLTQSITRLIQSPKLIPTSDLVETLSACLETAAQQKTKAKTLVDYEVRLWQDQFGPAPQPFTFSALYEAGLIAAATGNTRLVDKVTSFREQGLDLNWHAGAHRDTLIIAVARNREPSIPLIFELIGKGANPNSRNRRGETAAILAAALGNTDAVRALYDSGANLELADFTGRTALLAATQANAAETVRYLLTVNVSLKTTDIHQKNALAYALEKQFTDIVKLLLDNQQALEKLPRELTGPLLAQLAALGDLPHIKQLVSQDRNVLSRAPGGPEALLNAINSQHQEVVDYLLQQGISSNAQDKKGNTALMFAAALPGESGFGDLRLTNMLLDYGADSRLLNAEGKDAYAIALQNGRSDSAKRIKERTPRLATFAQQWERFGWHVVKHFHATLGILLLMLVYLVYAPRSQGLYKQRWLIAYIGSALVPMLLYWVIAMFTRTAYPWASLMFLLPSAIWIGFALAPDRYRFSGESLAHARRRTSYDETRLWGHAFSKMGQVIMLASVPACVVTALQNQEISQALLVLTLLLVMGGSLKYFGTTLRDHKPRIITPA